MDRQSQQPAHGAGGDQSHVDAPFWRAAGPTVFDFGLNGKPPAHARGARLAGGRVHGCGWSMKAIHHLIVTSQAYRMRSSSEAGDPRRQVDPDKDMLWRANPRRMEAETVRDCVLCVAGQLDLAAGGPDLEYSKGLSLPRRSLYFQHANEKQMTFLKVFDAAGVTECYRRSESIVPAGAGASEQSPGARAVAAAGRHVVAGSDRSGGRHGRAVHSAAFEQILSRTIDRRTRDRHAISVIAGRAAGRHLAFDSLCRRRSGSREAG